MVDSLHSQPLGQLYGELDVEVGLSSRSSTTNSSWGRWWSDGVTPDDVIVAVGLRPRAMGRRWGGTESFKIQSKTNVFADLRVR